MIKLGDKSRYIIGREANWVDVLLHHPSISSRQACIVHGTPPGTPENYAKSATLRDLAHGSNYYKKSFAKEKKYRIKKGEGVVLRENMCFIFADSTRIYEVIGLSVKGSRVAKTNASEIQTKDKVANAIVTRKLATLNPELAEKMKRTGGTAFSNQFGRHSEFHYSILVMCLYL